MATRKQSSFDGQSDGTNEKDNLVSQGVSHRDPYRAKPSEFSTSRVTPANGQGVDGGGKDELIKLSNNQLGPRHAQDSVTRGDNDSMQENAASIAANFKVSTNSGESSSAAGSPALAESVNCLTGKIEVKGYKATVVGEVPDRMVTL